MADLTVDQSCLAGFKLDLDDMGANFGSNASRYLPAIALPAGTTGLLAGLVSSLEKFNASVSAEHKTDLATLSDLSVNLSTASNKYQTTDESSSTAIVATSPDGIAGPVAPPSSVAPPRRYPGLHLPALPDAQDERCVVKEVVTAAIEQVKVYDNFFKEEVGIKPVEDFLAPLVSDWEALQAIGQRIGWLSTNDHILSENVTNGKNWLQNSWTGEASTTFAASVVSLAGTVSARSADLDVVAKIVENGAAVLGRQVYNQAMGVSGSVLKSISYQEASFPLGVWVQLANDPLPEPVKSAVSGAITELKQAAEARRTAIEAMVDTLSAALEYSPGRKAPAYNATNFEVPAVVTADPGKTKFGFGDNIWWEEANNSTDVSINA